MAYKGTRVAKKTPAQKAFAILGDVLCVIFAFTLICNLTIIIKGTLKPEAPPSVLGTTPLVVLSGSMSGDAPGHIEVGDLILVGRAKADELKEGDVIAFMQGDVTVTHRIIAIETGDDGKLLFTTKGDANNTEDQLKVHEDKLVGIYKSRIPGVGNFALFLQTPLGMMLFIGLPLLAFIVYDIIRRQRFMNHEQEKKAKLEAELRRLRALAGEEENL